MKVALAIAAMLLLEVWVDQFGWRPPSNHFMRLDRDHNLVLTPDEWMAYYGSHKDHPWVFCYGSRFQRADCNHDKLLTWKEYSAYVFSHRACDGRQYWDNLFDPEFQARAKLPRPTYDRATGHWRMPERPST